MSKLTCDGLTQRKIQCRRPVFENGYCRGHQDQYLDKKKRREQAEKYTKISEEKRKLESQEQKPIFDKIFSNFLESDYIILDEDENCPEWELRLVFCRYGMFFKHDMNLSSNIYNNTKLWEEFRDNISAKYGIKFIDNPESDRSSMLAQGCCINYLNTIISLHTSKNNISCGKSPALVAMQL